MTIKTFSTLKTLIIISIVTFVNLVGLFSEISASGFLSHTRTSASAGQATTGLFTAESAGSAAILPASMVFLDKGFHFLLGGYQQKLQTNFHPSNDSHTVSTDNTPAYDLYLFASWTGELFTRPISFGIGQHSAYGYKTLWQETWPGKHLVTEETLKVSKLPLNIAVAITDEISISGGINMIGATFEKKKNLYVSETSIIPTHYGVTSTGVGFNVSIMINHDIFACGAVYNNGIKIEGDGVVQFDTSEVEMLTAKYPDGNITYGTRLPAVLEFGAAFKDKKTNPSFYIEVSFFRTDWSDFNDFAISYDTQKPFTEEHPNRHREDVYSYKIGGYWSPHPLVKLRTGFFYENNSVSESAFDPSFPYGNDRRIFTYGVGFKIDKFIIDISDVRERIMTTEIDSPQSISGSYNAYSETITLDVGVKF